MTGAELSLTLGSCVAFMALVAMVAYYYTRGETDSKDGYFLAGRNLGGIFIAGSLLLTNLSAEQLIGLNGSAYGFNLSSMAWEVTAAISAMDDATGHQASLAEGGARRARSLQDSAGRLQQQISQFTLISVEEAETLPTLTDQG